MKKLDLRAFNQMNLVILFGVTVLANIFVGLGIGWFIYSKTDSKLFLILFLLLGVASGLYSGIKELLKEAERYDSIEKKINRDDD
ncbi:AtpZ/AtpI family protein [Oceanotoga sp. DSM 15011]|jgi:F0F1-type ATP synthase assembly protein I|uniref:F0F1-ATPase subunit (Ca2+/Mg2+ transporter) n=1 Tax=Oceanotoga teriensis TaxID=515440 RepID=A0AA45C775_9BACT|nr:MULTISPECIES: AtpZ/AtpI family protein [Oceanotoga]MDN5343074.1 synthase protein [Oceanotoga sp.]MDO7976716.1 AtpZ/AtpI family protein [Oceanotoga teriensis]PWJ95237.1 putative F0F1-ATPase subunit (Ca2+/Mg2+ transporter) [Oceanotoga teriensis]UYP00637.1 AtpZ/AtpI family protein [Oceanotoga sp. DSM 15011]